MIVVDWEGEDLLCAGGSVRLAQIGHKKVCAGVQETKSA